MGPKADLHCLGLARPFTPLLAADLIYRCNTLERHPHNAVNRKQLPAASTRPLFISHHRLNGAAASGIPRSPPHF